MDYITEDKMFETNKLVSETMLNLYGKDRSGKLLRSFITKLIAISKLKSWGIDDENKLYVVTKDEYEKVKRDLRGSKMKEERIFIQIIEHDDGSRTYAVGGGTKNNGQMENFHTPKECLEEIKQRTALTLLEM